MASRQPVFLLLVAAAMVVVMLCATPVSSCPRRPPPRREPRVDFNCTRDRNHRRDTIQQVDCSDRRHRNFGVSECKELCVCERRCVGVIFLADRRKWENRKYCCFLKSRFTPLVHACGYTASLTSRLGRWRRLWGSTSKARQGATLVKNVHTHFWREAPYDDFSFKFGKRPDLGRRSS